MKPGRILILLSLCILGMIIYLNKCKSTNSQNGKAGPKGPQTIMVSGVIASQSSLDNEISSTGTVLANEEAEIRNEISARVTSIFFREGTSVKKGELLVKLNDDELQATLEKLVIQHQLAEKNATRQKDLLTIHGISEQEYETSLNQLNSLTADLDFIKASIAKTEIRAPFDGIIGLKNISPGAFLATNTLIARIQDIDPVKIDFSVPEKYREMISNGSEIRFTTEGSKKEFTGKVYAFEPKIDVTTRSFLVRALCANPEKKIFPGSFVSLIIPLRKIENTIQIPTQCILPELKGQSVYISENGLAKKVKVQTGIRNDSTIQITNGLNAGDTILTTGIMQVRPEMSLKITIVN